MQSPTYDEIFQRNIGVFTPEEQDKIKNLKVAIIGVGGLGAPAAENLTRLGVGELRFVEPDEFEVSNLNRQTGAYIKTINKNKAEVLAETARQINPEIILTINTEKLFGDELKEFICGCDIVLDGIDYFNIDETIELHRLAKEMKIPLVTAAACFNIISYSYFDPEKVMLPDLITSDDYVEKVMQATYLFFPVFPAELTEEVIAGMMQSYLSGKGSIEISSYSVTPALVGAIITKYIVDILVKTDNKTNIPVMPDMLYLDTNALEFKRVNR